jgi:deoxyribonuclease V
VDVHYPADGGARAAAVVASDPRFTVIDDERIAALTDVAPYEPGRFYLRELPAIHAVLDGLDGLDLIVVDGYVDLDPQGHSGLGAHVHEEFGVPVIGVAKTAFHTATHARPVLRGQATRPLYVTAAGLGLDQAADLVRTMTGPHRMPDALRRVDALSRRLRTT